MKITLKELRNLIRESVKSELEKDSSTFIDAIKERSTNDQFYIDLVKDIFSTHASDPYNTGKKGIYAHIPRNREDNRKVAVRELLDNLELSDEQKEQILRPRGYIATFFFGTTFPIYLENLAALAKTVEDELGIDLENR